MPHRKLRAAPDSVPKRRFLPAWVLVGSAALTMGALFRSSEPIYSPSFIYTGRGEQPPPALWTTVIPLGLAFHSAATAFLSPRRSGGLFLTLPVVGALLTYVGAAALTKQRYADSESLLLLLQLLGGASLAAAGNHGSKGHPDRKLPRILAGLGGGVLFVSFLRSQGDGVYSRSILASLSHYLFYATGHRASAWFAAALLTYGVFGLLSPFARRSSPARHRAISVLGYLLLLGFPIALYLEWWEQYGGYAVLQVAKGDSLYPAWMECWEARTMMIQEWLLVTGHTILLAVGIAAWTEEALGAKREAPDTSGAVASQT